MVLFWSLFFSRVHTRAVLSSISKQNQQPTTIVLVSPKAQKDIVQCAELGPGDFSWWEKMPDMVAKKGMGIGIFGADAWYSAKPLDV